MEVEMLQQCPVWATWALIMLFSTQRHNNAKRRYRKHHSPAGHGADSKHVCTPDTYGTRLKAFVEIHRDHH